MKLLTCKNIRWMNIYIFNYSICNYYFLKKWEGYIFENLSELVWNCILFLLLTQFACSSSEFLQGVSRIVKWCIFMEFFGEISWFELCIECLFLRNRWHSIRIKLLQSSNWIPFFRRKGIHLHFRSTRLWRLLCLHILFRMIIITFLRIDVFIENLDSFHVDSRWCPC